MKTIHWLLLTLSLLATTGSVLAQVPAPPPPFMRVVSIDPATNDVSMKWDHPQTLDPLDFYTPYILEYPRVQTFPVNCDLGPAIPFPSITTTIPGTSTASCILPPGTTLHDILNVAPQGFGVKVKSTISPDYSPLSDYHFPSRLSVIIDSCSAQANLSWTKYTATDHKLDIPDASPHLNFNNSIEYEVWGYEGNPPFNQATATLLRGKSKDTTFTSTILDKNKNYFFFIKAYLPQGSYLPNDEISYSNRISAEYKGLAVPTYIDLSRVEARDGSVELTFQIDPVSELTTYRIERTTDITQGFSIIYEFPDRTRTSYTDNDVTSDEQYFYRISAIRCDRIVQQSDISNTILLSSQFQPNDGHLDWLPFIRPGSTYSITRVVPDNVTTATGIAGTNHIDNILPNIQQGYDKFCYRVTGVDANGHETISMPSCFIVEPPVHMPDAIDPTQTLVNATSGGQRNRFGPVVDMNSTSYGYKLTVFNRWGAIVYENKKEIGVAPIASNYWDGTYKNKLVEPGLYLYTITVYFPNSQVSLKGDVSVFY